MHIRYLICVLAAGLHTTSMRSAEDMTDPISRRQLAYENECKLIEKKQALVAQKQQVLNVDLERDSHKIRSLIKAFDSGDLGLRSSKDTDFFSGESWEVTHVAYAHEEVTIPTVVLREKKYYEDTIMDFAVLLNALRSRGKLQDPDKSLIEACTARDDSNKWLVFVKNGAIFMQRKLN